MPTVVDILTFMSMINFMLSYVEHEQSLIASWLFLCLAAGSFVNLKLLSGKRFNKILYECFRYF